MFFKKLRGKPQARLHNFGIIHLFILIAALMSLIALIEIGMISSM